MSVKVAEKESIIGLGLMSGTSLDGLDLCLVSFGIEDNDARTYSILKAETIAYDTPLQSKLVEAENMSGLDILKFNNEYGRFLGQSALAFINKHGIKPRFIASHGHTIFHQPNEHFTYQIGSGACIAAETGITTIADFRSLDVALQGQGAPLVPIGDELLFHQYDYCLNLGGFANISARLNEQRIAYDICPVNIVLNTFTRKIGLEYDAGGVMARSGSCNQNLLQELNALPYYKQSIPKSLGKEWVLSECMPVINKYDIDLIDILHTFSHHVAIQLSAHVAQGKSVLVTGGGSYNSFIIDLFKSYSNANIIIPDDFTIQFKEALIFAFLGLLRLEGNNNALRSVTGARIDNIGGCVYAMK